LIKHLFKNWSGVLDTTTAIRVARLSLAAWERQKLYCAAIALERATCNGAQHEETQCMTDTAQRLLENAMQHARARAVETEQACQAWLMIDVVWHTEWRRVVRTKDQLWVGHHMALGDLQYPLANPQVDWQVLKCLNEQCNHCGFRFWIKEHTRGSLQRPHYSKCYALGKILLPPIRTPPEYMAMLQDR
jgi:hypothetical protein